MRMGRLALSMALILVFYSFANSQKQDKAQAPPAKSGQAQTKNADAKKPRTRVVTDLSGFDLLEDSKLKKQAGVAAGTRGMPIPVALAPRLGGSMIRFPPLVYVAVVLWPTPRMDPLA
jgi:hypothetical protein